MLDQLIQRDSLVKLSNQLWLYYIWQCIMKLQSVCVGDIKATALLVSLCIL